MYSTVNAAAVAGDLDLRLTGVDRQLERSNTLLGEKRNERSHQGDDPGYRPRGRRVQVDRLAGAAGQRADPPETVERVRKAIEDVGYVYNRGAANLRKAQSNVVGMVINDLSNPFYSELAVAIERVFQSAGIIPFIANTAESPVRQDEVLKSLMEQGVAGLIVSPARGTAPDAFRRSRPPPFQ